MIQRYIYTALTEGFDAIKADITILEEFFTEVYDLSTVEVAAIREVFEKQPPRVLHGYPRSDTKFPCVAIILGSENESLNFIGDDGGIVEDPEDENFGADIKTAGWKHTYHLLVGAEHPDVTLYYYELVKHIVLTAGDFLDGKGLWGYNYSGADLMPDRNFLPENVFARQFTLQAEREFQNLDKASKLGKAFRVRGIHIDKSGSSGDVGGVKTLVTTYAVDPNEE